MDITTPSSPSALQRKLPEWMTALEASTSLEIPVSMKNLMKLIECPICFEYMRPATKQIAMCDNGHMFCHPCGQKVNNSDNDHCPICRIDEITVIKNHYLAINLIEIVSDWIEYQCKHDKCEVTLRGRKIIDHEKYCEWKPLLCVKKLCTSKVPYKNFLAREHNCLSIVEGADKNSVRVWKFKMNFQDIYNYDTHNEQISARLKPFLMVPPNPESNPHDKLFVSAMTVSLGGGIIFILGSLEPGEDLSKEIKEKHFVMTVTIRTPLGKIGYANKVSPLTEGETVNSEKHGVFMWRSTILHYLQSVTDSGCQKCPTSDMPHMHITVKEFGV